MSQINQLKKVAIVGATGNIGKHFAEALLETGNHTVTALTRADSKGTVPAGVKSIQVNYDDPESQSLISALKGQDFLVITLSVLAPQDTHSKITQAAVKAGVPYIMPNVYGTDIFDEAFRKDMFYGEIAYGYCKEIEELGASFIAMSCGFWYEWSLALGEQWFGFDIKSKKVTFFDDGKTKISSSTWEQCGRGLAALLSFPVKGAKPSLSDWKNKSIYLASFHVCQRDMLDSIHRVIGTTDKDWEITYEPTAKRFEDGKDEMAKGERTGFAKMLYARAFFPDGNGDLETTRELDNGVLGLQKEDLDKSTEKAIAMVESGWSPFG